MGRPKSYPVTLTGAQLRVLREVLSAVMNDPDGWQPFVGAKDWPTLERASSTIISAHGDAMRAESTPAGSL